jgi:hypothetical protein
MKDGGTVFPHNGHGGASLRDWFAGNARLEDLYIPETQKGAAAFLGIPEGEYDGTRDWYSCVSKARYIYADAMLEERGRNES